MKSSGNIINNNHDMWRVALTLSFTKLILQNKNVPPKAKAAGVISGKYLWYKIFQSEMCQTLKLKY